MGEEKNLESPRTITIENNTKEDIIFQWRLTGNTEIVEPGDTIKFTVLASEDLSFYEDQFRELNIEFEEDEPTPPTPEPGTVYSSIGKFQVNLTKLGNALGTLSEEAWYNSNLVVSSTEICIVLGTYKQYEFGLRFPYTDTLTFTSSDDDVVGGVGGACLEGNTMSVIVTQCLAAGTDIVEYLDQRVAPLTLNLFTDKIIVRVDGQQEIEVPITMPDDYMVPIESNN